MEMFWNEKDCFEKDRLVAGIVHHLHPEIDYKRVYPCLAGEDLSNEAVFGQKLPDAPDIVCFDDNKGTFISIPICNPYDEEKMKNRIEKADELHRVMQNEQTPDIVMQDKHEELNESLLKSNKHSKDSMELQ